MCLNDSTMPVQVYTQYYYMVIHQLCALFVGMMPLWLYTLGSTLPAEDGVEKIKIPFLSILGSFAALVIPLLIGVLVKHKLPRVSKVIRKCLKVCVITISHLSTSLCLKNANFLSQKLDLLVRLFKIISLHVQMVPLAGCGSSNLKRTELFKV